MAVVRAPIGVTCDFEAAPRALSSSRSSARKSRRGERFWCETRCVKCEDFFFQGRAHHTAFLAPRVGPRTRWDPSRMSLEARVIHFPPPPLVVMTLWFYLGTRKGTTRTRARRALVKLSILDPRTCTVVSRQWALVSTSSSASDVGSSSLPSGTCEDLFGKSRSNCVAASACSSFVMRVCA